MNQTLLDMEGRRRNQRSRRKTLRKEEIKKNLFSFSLRVPGGLKIFRKMILL